MTLAREEAERLYASPIQASIMQAIEEALHDIFQTGIKLLKGGLKNSPNVFVKHMLTVMAYNGSQEDLFNCSIKSWTQSSSFMYAFAKRVFTSFRGFRPIAKFNFENLKESSEVMD